MGSALRGETTRQGCCWVLWTKCCPRVAPVPGRASTNDADISLVVAEVRGDVQQHVWEPLFAQLSGNVCYCRPGPVEGWGVGSGSGTRPCQGAHGQVRPPASPVGA